MRVRLFLGDASATLNFMAAESVDCVITSPPYFGLRDFGLPAQVWDGDPLCPHVWGRERTASQSGGGWADPHHAQYARKKDWDQGQKSRGRFCRRCGAWYGCLGLEPDVGLYLTHLTGVFRAVRRVLKPTGTLWLNMGDCYRTTPAGDKDPAGSYGADGAFARRKGRQMRDGNDPQDQIGYGLGLKPKDLCGVPWRVALALQEDGWWLRSDIIWHKPNPMPESCRDRPTKAHEYLFLLAKSAQYFYDRDAIREPPGNEWSADDYAGRLGGEGWGGAPGEHGAARRHRGETKTDGGRSHPQGRNKRTVWTITPKPCPGTHFATFPPALVEPCVLAGTSAKGNCARCGAPWRPEVAVSRAGPSIVNGPAYQSLPTLPSGYRHNPTRRLGPDIEDRREVVGWEPTCDCRTPKTTPAVVLDPFCGTGTVGEVALRLGRRFVGIELSSEYLLHTRRRLRV